MGTCFSSEFPEFHLSGQLPSLPIMCNPNYGNGNSLKIYVYDFHFSKLLNGALQSMQN